MNLRGEDVILHGDEVSLRLGVAARQEKTKTGYHQGVRVDRPHVKAILRRRAAACHPKSKLFKITPAAFRLVWRQTCCRLGLDLGPPHTLRHSGPSHDLYYSYRSILQIQRRGRWSSEKSSLRYAKTHTLIEARAALPPKVLEAGSLILSNRASRPAVAPE